MVRYYISIYKEKIYEKNLTQLKPVVPSTQKKYQQYLSDCLKVAIGLVCRDS